MSEELDQGADTPSAAGAGWFNRTVVGAGLTSFLADLGYETAGSVLPMFLMILGLPAPLLLGMIEGTADVLSSALKLGAGYFGDRLPRRKPLVVFAYALTGLANGLYAGAAVPWIVTAKLLAWAGKGIRGPLRNAILADAVAPADRGKAFGLHRAGDTLGAVLGPLLGAAVLFCFAPDGTAPVDRLAIFQGIFLLTLVPGLGAALAFALLIPERRREPTGAKPFGSALRDLPTTFWRQLAGMFVFGVGNFSDKLLILAAVQMIAPDIGQARAFMLGLMLMAWRNAVQAVAAYPLGALGDRVGRRTVLIAGYLLGATTMLGFAAADRFEMSSGWVLFGLLGAAGAYLAVDEALEGAVTADLVPDSARRGTAYGVLAAANGAADFIASLVAGLLMQFVGLTPAFVVAASLMLAGAALLKWLR